jgi:Ca-activated chloride channel family protein
LPKSVFDADTVQVFALFSQPPRGELTLSGQRSRRGEPACIGRVSLSATLSDGDIVPRMVAHERIKTLSPAEAMSLAVAYQLITPWTNFLLVHERATEDKAEDMPELHAVKHMLPAGWGGAGSVLSVDEPALMCAQACYGDVDSPVMHSRRRKGQASLSQEYLDIPAFLRRQADPEPSVGDRGRNDFESRVSSPGGSDSLDWENEPHGAHSPKDFLTYLMGIPQSAWPRTYGDLRDLGLEPEIIDWLEEIFASEYPAPLAETVVIEVFLCALLEEPVYRRIMQGDGPLQRLRHSLKQVFGLAPSPGDTAHRQLVADLAAYMAGIAPDAWPEVMKAEPRTLS